MGRDTGLNGMAGSICTWGEPYERGVQHGYLLAPELRRSRPIWITSLTGALQELSYFVDAADRFPEAYRCRVFAGNARHRRRCAGAPVLNHVAGHHDLNGYEELTVLVPNEQQRLCGQRHCSAHRHGSQTRDANRDGAQLLECVRDGH